MTGQRLWNVGVLWNVSFMESSHVKGARSARVRLKYNKMKQNETKNHQNMN